MTELKGKVALITGASRGIGKAVAKALAGEGVKLALHASSPDSLQSIKEELTAIGADILLCPADLASPQSPAQIISQVIRQFGTLDILINNAGIALGSALENTTTEQWDLLLSVNARAPFFLCKEALPHLRRSKAATIINISSVLGNKGYANQAAYTASKHALMGFTKVLAQEVHQDGIRVHALCPGAVATEMVAISRPDLNLEELITPQDLADIILFLLTHRGNAMIDEIDIRRASNSPWK